MKNGSIVEYVREHSRVNPLEILSAYDPRGRRRSGLHRNTGHTRIVPISLAIFKSYLAFATVSLDECRRRWVPTA